jgi:molecular chaperone DnaK (HSP70)
MALFHMQTNVKSIDNREMPLMTVIAESLRFIANKALSKLEEQIGKGVQMSKIRWVLTVPALWSEEHKLFMRKAAVEANIIDHSNSPNLLLCLEPEGASIQCREDAEDTLKEKMIKDTVVLVLDCGGGTVDITVHKLKSDPEENFLCEEILPSSGGCEWGSKYVDIYFEEFLCEFFGDELYNIYLKNAVARLEILKYFEMLKRKFNPGKDERSRLQLSYLSEDLTPTKLSELVEKHNKNSPSEIQLKQRGASCIDIPPMLMMSFFKPLFENIMSKVETLLDQAKQKVGYSAKFIFMVGGFSESPYLKNEVKKRFETETLSVLVPRRPQVSVIRGACMYGLNPRTITSRIAKKTYGINTLTTFDPERHPEEKKVVIEGEDFCEDVFDIFVRKDESVSIDEFHTKTYCPVRSRQTVMRIIFYCTDATEVDFVDEKGVSQLGELSIDIGKPFQSVEDKTVKVTLMFGTTHIYATATNKESTEIKKCEFKFESAN